MKKIALFFMLISLLSAASSAGASLGFFKPDSKLYFLQPALESTRLFFTFSKEGKIDYILQLTQRRVDEMTAGASVAMADRYQTHFQDLEKLVNEAKDKEQIIEKIKEASLRQQEVLSDVYAKVPDRAKDAILNAQENSSKNVANVIETVEGADKAREYIERVEQIQLAPKMERAERLEQAQMEGNPQANPSENVPQGLKEGKEILPGKDLNPLNPVLDGQGGSGVDKTEPAVPIETQQPAPRQ